jgi:SAM-dependent methyltransferase
MSATAQRCGLARTTKKPRASLCRICGAAAMDRFMQIHDMPVYCNVLLPSREEALHVPKGSLDLAYCRQCGHIFNLAFDPSVMNYTPAYENSLHFSPGFQRYAEDIAHHLVRSYGVRNKVAIDIGCGKGDFLAILCEAGGNRGIGFDRSYSPGTATHKTSLDLTFVPDFFEEKDGVYRPDLICCRHVLEHMEAPRDLLGIIRRALGTRQEVIVFFEVPNAAYTIRDLGIWDLIYEHCSYFSENSLLTLFRMNGFVVRRLSQFYSGQYLGIEASLGEELPTAEQQRETLSDEILSFPARYLAKIESWRDELGRLERSGKRVVVWGAGSKGITFLNVLAAASVEYVIDINPRKHGRYVGGAGAKVMPPEFLAAYQPDAVIAMNSIYRDEISSHLRLMGLSPEIRFA